MDIRIINKEGNMFCVGERTLRTNGKVLALIDKDNHLEAIQTYESEENAKGVKKAIIDKVKSAMDFEMETIVISI